MGLPARLPNGRACAVDVSHNTRWPPLSAEASALPSRLIASATTGCWWPRSDRGASPPDAESLISPSSEADATLLACSDTASLRTDAS